MGTMDLLALPLMLLPLPPCMHVGRPVGERIAPLKMLQVPHPMAQRRPDAPLPVARTP